MNIYNAAIQGKETLKTHLTDFKAIEKQQLEKNEISKQAKDAWLLHPVTVEHFNKLQTLYEDFIDKAMMNANNGENDKATRILIRAHVIKNEFLNILTK